MCCAHLVCVDALWRVLDSNPQSASQPCSFSATAGGYRTWVGVSIIYHTTMVSSEHRPNQVTDFRLFDCPGSIAKLSKHEEYVSVFCAVIWAMSIRVRRMSIIRSVLKPARLIVLRFVYMHVDGLHGCLHPCVIYCFAFCQPSHLFTHRLRRTMSRILLLPLLIVRF